MTTPTSQSALVMPFSYATGMKISYASATTLTVASGQCSDSTNTINIEVSEDTTINGAVNGLNGLDTGSLANSTLYAVFAIADSYGRQLPGYILSTSSTSPYLPQGYNAVRRIGWWYTNGSANFVIMYQRGQDLTRSYYYDTLVSLGALTSATFAAVSLTTGVPPINTLVKFQADVTPTAAGNAASFRLSGSSSTNGSAYVSGVVAGQVQSAQVVVPCAVVSGVAKIDYKVTGSLTLYIAGFEDYI